VIVGEVRGGEAFDMLQALNTGHDGSLSTVHANSAADALARLETLVLLAGTGLPLGAVRSQLASALDGVIFVARRSGGTRRVEQVAELVVAPDGPAVRSLYSWRDGRLVPAATPTRAPRRPDAPCFDFEWFAC
jgi:pilus assembly protein CpaF